MSISSQKERQRSWIEALDQNNTQSRKISEENVLPPKLTSAYGLIFLSRLWTENRNPRFLHLLNS